MAESALASVVDVILPVYNAEAYLGDSLQSVVGQSFVNWRLLAVDDGSTDRTREILYQWSRQDPRIQVITKTNAGPGAARNLALGHVSAPWVCFLDGDDLLHPDYLKRLLELALDRGADLALGGAISFHDGTGMPTFEGTGLLALPIALDTQTFSVLTPDFRRRFFAVGLANWGKLYRADLIRDLRFSENRGGFEDKPFVIGALHRARAIAYTRQPLYYYRIRKGSVISHLSADRPNPPAVEDFLKARASCRAELAPEPDLLAAYDARDSAQFAQFFPWISHEERLAALGIERDYKEAGPRPPQSWSPVGFNLRYGGSLPDYLFGFSSPEPWGCWITGIPAVVGLPHPIQGPGELVIEGGGFGACVGAPVRIFVGSEEHEVRFDAGPMPVPQRLKVTIGPTASVWQLTILVPTLTSPGNGDPRLLGIGLTKIEFYPDALS